MRTVLLVIILVVSIIFVYNYKRYIERIEDFENVTSCTGWACNKKGDYCPPGVPGSTPSNGPGYCCRKTSSGGLRWRRGKCPVKTNKKETDCKVHKDKNKSLANEILNLKNKIVSFENSVDRRELFDILEKQYSDKLSKLALHNALLNKNNQIISEQNDTIEKQKNILMNKKDEIQTSRRQLLYEQKDDLMVSKIFGILKLILLILGTMIIMYLLGNMYFKEQIDMIMDKTKNLSSNLTKTLTT